MTRRPELLILIGPVAIIIILIVVGFILLNGGSSEEEERTVGLTAEATLNSPGRRFDGIRHVPANSLGSIDNGRCQWD